MPVDGSMRSWVSRRFTEGGSAKPRTATASSANTEKASIDSGGCRLKNQDLLLVFKHRLPLLRYFGNLRIETLCFQSSSPGIPRASPFPEHSMQSHCFLDSTSGRHLERPLGTLGRRAIDPAKTIVERMHYFGHRRASHAQGNLLAILHSS